MAQAQYPPIYTKSQPLRAKPTYPLGNDKNLDKKYIFCKSIFNRWSATFNAINVSVKGNGMPFY